VVSAQPYPNPGTPLAGWRVLLGTNDCRLISSAVTDADGVYRFPDLDPGTYTVEIAFDQPYGQGWELLEPSPRIGVCWGGGQGAIMVEAGQAAAANTIKVALINDPRGYFGSVFNDANENGKRDGGESGFATSMRELDSDIIIEFATDMEGNFRSVESATPNDPRVPPPPRLSLTTCPASPTERANRSGYRITAPVPSSCGSNGCITQVADQVFQCPDFGVHLVDPNPAYFVGEVWVNAAPVAAGTLVTAWIGSTACGEGYVWGNGPLSWYDVIVRSANTRAGCGADGAEVRFTLNGQSTPAVGYWHVRDMQEPEQQVDIIVGPPFAVYDIEVATTPTDERRERSVQAYVGNTLCAEGRASASGIVRYPRVTLPIPPESLHAGCGSEGATVHFVVDGVANPQTVIWSAGKHDLILTPATLQQPNTGSGAAEGRSQLPIWAGLGLVALAAVAALSGFGLRRSAR
jgi:hypothetical protein